MRAIVYVADRGLWKPSMSVFDFLKEVVETIAIDETTVWGETRHASVGILIAGAKQNPSICFIRRAKWEGDSLVRAHSLSGWFPSGR